MDKAIMITIGIFLYGLFGNIVNYVIYYGGVVFRLIFDLLYYVGSLMDMTIIGATIINIAFYFILFKLFKSLLGLFTNV